MYIRLRILLKRLFRGLPFFWKIIETLQGLVYIYDYFYYYKIWGHENRFSIKEFNIEFASNCNLRCKFCSLDHLKPKQLITQEILIALLDNFIKDKRFLNISVINLHNGGETLMHPKRIEMLKVIKEYKNLANSLKIKFPKIYLLTNGMLLRKELARQIIELDVIDTLTLSMDGGTPEAFEEMRTNARWSIFYKNLKTFCYLNNQNEHKIETSAICCIPNTRRFTTKWMHSEFRDALNILDRYEIRRLHNWAGEIKNVSKARNKPHKIGCTLLMKQMVLLPNGDITVCCTDLNSKGFIGNILSDDIISIYKSKNRMNYLNLLLIGQKSKLDLCKDCETF